MYTKLLISILFTHSSTSEHNKFVKATIISEICTNPNMNHTKDEITGWFNVRYLICIYIHITTLHKYTVVVKRKYEALRRLWHLEEREDCDEVKRETAVKKYRQRLRRVICYPCALAWPYLSVIAHASP